MLVNKHVGEILTKAGYFVRLDSYHGINNVVTWQVLDDRYKMRPYGRIFYLDGCVQLESVKVNIGDPDFSAKLLLMVAKSCDSQWNIYLKCLKRGDEIIMPRDLVEDICTSRIFSI